jgi:hypothetical protein
MPKKTIVRGRISCFLAVLLIPLLVPAQGDRGKAELSAGGGKIVIDYGRPQLKGRDPLTWQKDGDYWRMGRNEMTTFTTPIDLVFGTTRITRGRYALWLLKVSADRYELVFNSETSGMGMNHDKSKDVAAVPLEKRTASDAVETLTIELKDAPGGGVFSLDWGTVRLSCNFQFGM